MWDQKGNIKKILCFQLCLFVNASSAFLSSLKKAIYVGSLLRLFDPVYIYYYTLNSLSLFKLAECIQWIFEISACDVITADYTIIMSRTLKVADAMGHFSYNKYVISHVKFPRFVLPSVKKHKHDFLFRLMYNKTIIRFGFCHIQNNLPRPSDSTDNPYLDLDYSSFV